MSAASDRGVYFGERLAELAQLAVQPLLARRVLLELLGVGCCSWLMRSALLCGSARGGSDGRRARRDVEDAVLRLRQLRHQCLTALLMAPIVRVELPCLRAVLEDLTVQPLQLRFRLVTAFGLPVAVRAQRDDLPLTSSRWFPYAGGAPGG